MKTPVSNRDKPMRCLRACAHLETCVACQITDTILSKFHLDVAKESFDYHGASLFNSLPMNITTLSPMERFQVISAFYS